MLNIDRARLDTDLPYRVEFIRDFIEFDSEDAKILNRLAPLVMPIMRQSAQPQRRNNFTDPGGTAVDIVDGVYDHLFEYSTTKEVFLKRGTFEGDLATALSKLTIDDPLIQLRKKFLTFWLARIFTGDYTKKDVWDYMDKVGLMHTGVISFAHRAGTKPLIVDLHVCSLLLGWIANLAFSVIMHISHSHLSTADKLDGIRAINKITWLQNDLRHYVRSDEEMAAHAEEVKAKSVWGEKAADVLEKKQEEDTREAERAFDSAKAMRSTRAESAKETDE